jgi:threonine dehydratase
MAHNVAAAAYEAYESTRFHLRSTPLERSEWLEAAIAAADAASPAPASASTNPASAPLPSPPPPRCFLKLESEQHTGSFKARGALNKALRALRSGAGAVAGFTTASTGNHALATIWAVGAATAARSGSGSGISNPAAPLPELVVYVAENADATKVARLRAAAAAAAAAASGGAATTATPPPPRVRVVVEGRDCAEAETAARRAAAERRGWRYISPYNDPDVIAGQGSLAVEMLAQLRRQRHTRGRPLAAFVPVGGGGLLAGVAAVLKAALGPGACTVYGCQPATNDVMRRSVAEGQLLDLPEVAAAPTLSDATAGGVEPGAVTFTLCRDLVDHWVTVTEQEIADAMCSALEHGGKLIEGSAGVAIASVLKVGRRGGGGGEGGGGDCAAGLLAGRDVDVAVVCCGGNVGVATLKRVLEVGRAVELQLQV